MARFAGRSANLYPNHICIARFWTPSLQNKVAVDKKRVLGEGAEGLWTSHCFALVQPQVGPMQEACHSLVPKMFHPLLTWGQHGLLRSVLRSGSQLLRRALQKVLRRVLRRCLLVGFKGKKGAQNGSQKEFLEGVSPEDA